MRSKILTQIFRVRGMTKAIAEACGISTAAVAQWNQVPAKRVAVVSQLTGIPMHKLRAAAKKRPLNAEVA